jgi:hypothetical protein
MAVHESHTSSLVYREERERLMLHPEEGFIEDRKVKKEDLFALKQAALSIVKARLFQQLVASHRR